MTDGSSLQPTFGKAPQERGQNLDELIRPIVLIATVMHEHDVAALHRIEALFDRLRRAERAPVDGTDIPQHHLLAAALRFIAHARTIAPVRRTIETRRHADHIAQRLRSVTNLRTRGAR